MAISNANLLAGLGAIPLQQSVQSMNTYGVDPSGAANPVGYGGALAGLLGGAGGGALIGRELSRKAQEKILREVATQNFKKARHDAILKTLQGKQPLALPHYNSEVVASTVRRPGFLMEVGSSGTIHPTTKTVRGKQLLALPQPHNSRGVMETSKPVRNNSFKTYIKGPETVLPTTKTILTPSLESEIASGGLTPKTPAAKQNKLGKWFSDVKTGPQKKFVAPEIAPISKAKGAKAKFGAGKGGLTKLLAENPRMAMMGGALLGGAMLSKLLGRNLTQDHNQQVAQSMAAYQQQQALNQQRLLMQPNVANIYR